MMSGRKTLSRGDCTAIWRPRPNAARPDFSELLLVPGVGARTVRALAMVAEVVHGAPYRFSDPARFSVAHGGKDRHPFPCRSKVYDQTIEVLKSAVRRRSSADPKSSRRSSGWTNRPAAWNDTLRALGRSVVRRRARPLAPIWRAKRVWRGAAARRSLGAKSRGRTHAVRIRRIIANIAAGDNTAAKRFYQDVPWARRADGPRLDHNLRLATADDCPDQHRDRRRFRNTRSRPVDRGGRC